MRCIKYSLLWGVVLLVGVVCFPLKAQVHSAIERVDSLLSEGSLAEATTLIDALQEELGDKKQDALLLREIKLSFLQGDPYTALARTSALSKKFLKKEEVRSLLAALLYHSYRFEDLSTLQEAPKGKVKSKGNGYFPKRLLEQAERAERLVESAQLLEVVDSFTVSHLEDLRHASGLSSEVGNLSFGTGTEDYRYTTALGFETFTHRIGDDGKNHIFYVKKTASGEILEERELEELHLPGGEYFPILRQDGQSILFASPTGAIDLDLTAQENGDFSEGIGGLDLYMSRRDPHTGKFQVPTLLGMPFNSPSDDLILLYDDFYHVGLLVTTRFARKGFYNCYRFVMSETAPPLPTNDYELKKKYAALRPWRLTERRAQSIAE